VLSAAHAVRVLRPWTTDTKAADRALAIAALAAFVACGSPARADARNQPRADDRELMKAAIESNDDHLAKLVVAAIDEEAAHEDAIYRIAATRAVRRGKS
jgi:cation diffusion facilitator CzcD-associated flavoprotein CzcO